MSTSLARSAAVGVIAVACITPILAATPAVAAASLCGPPADTVPPQVTSLSLSKTSVNLDHGSRTVTITAHATDGSGSSSPSGVKHIAVNLDKMVRAVQLKRTAGTSADGTWSGSFTVSQFSAPGTRTIRQVNVIDQDSNQTSYARYVSTATSPTDIGLQTGWQTSFTVTGTPAKRPARLAAGKLTHFSFSPTTINTTKAAKSLRFKATVSGRQPTSIAVDIGSTREPRVLVNTATLTRTATSKTWTGRFQIPRGSGRHTYQADVRLTFASTLKPLGRYYDSQQLESTFFQPPLTVISNPANRELATMTGLSLTKRSVNTTTDAQTVGVTATLVDPKLEVDYADVGFQDHTPPVAPAAGLYPHGVGYSTDGEVSAVLKHASGNKWTATVTFPQCVPSGKWTVFVYAGTPHRAVSHLAKPTKAGLPTSIQVISTPGDSLAPTLYSSKVSSSAGTVTLGFSEGVKNVSNSDLAVYALSPAASAFENAIPISGIACKSGTTAADCSGSAGLVTSAVLTVPAVSGKAGDRYEVWANQGSVTSQLVDPFGNPMDWTKPAALDTA